MQAAESLLDNPDPATQNLIKEKAVQGLAPPAPPETFGVWVNEDEATRQEYMRTSSDKLFDGKPAVKYFWVEMSAEERSSPALQLSNEFENTQASDASVNRTRPAWETRRYPMISPSDASGSSEIRMAS